MNKTFQDLYKHLPKDAQELLYEIDKIVHQSVSSNLNEKIWSKMPMYYIGSRSIILALFSDHINIVSNPAIYKNEDVHPNAVLANKDALTEYKITPKGMLQIYVNDKIPTDLLFKIFRDNFDESIR